MPGLLREHWVLSGILTLRHHNVGRKGGGGERHRRNKGTLESPGEWDPDSELGPSNSKPWALSPMCSCGIYAGIGKSCHVT